MAAPGQGRLYGSFYDDGDFQLATGDCHFWPPPTTFIRPPVYTFARPGTRVRASLAFLAPCSVHFSNPMYVGMPFSSSAIDSILTWAEAASVGAAYASGATSLAFCDAGDLPGAFLERSRHASSGRWAHA